jgi:hypothetical protein
MSADTSGVLQLASNNGTVAVTVSTSQNVGIGTASPNAKLEVFGQRIRINSASDPGIEIANAVDVKGYLFYNTGGADVITLRHSSGTGINLDASGRMTVPSQTAFYVYANGADTYSGTGWSKMRLATYSAPTNEFNTSLVNFTTHQFTAPVAGKYFFSAAVTMTGSTNTDGTIGFAINGASNPSGGRSTAYASGTGLGGMDCVNVLNLAAGDTVAVYFYQSGSQTTRNTQYAGYFCGYLLG